MNNKHPEVQQILQSNNHYDILGIGKNAKKDQIRQAYK